MRHICLILKLALYKCHIIIIIIIIIYIIFLLLQDVDKIFKSILKENISYLGAPYNMDIRIKYLDKCLLIFDNPDSLSLSYMFFDAM